MNQEPQCNYLPDWKNTEEICIIFEDNTDKEKQPPFRRPEEIDSFFSAIKKTAAEHGWNLNIWGNRAAFEKNISKKYIKAKIIETTEARDAQIIQNFPTYSESLSLSLKNIPLPEVKY